MTPKPESETDPWQTVKRYQRHVGGTFLSPVGRWCSWHEVDAARARLTCWRCGTAAYQPNERCDSHMSWTDRLQTEVEHHNAWRKRADEAEAERDRLKAALSTAAFALDLAGFRRDRDAAYAALTPQGQSTDGETR